MELKTLNVNTREVRGTSGARATRRAAKVPMVLYGGGQEPLALAADLREFTKLLHGRGGEHAIVQLQVADRPEASGPALMKDVQHHPLKGTAVHADFQRIRMDERITTLVQIELVGQPKGVLAGGVLDQQMREVEVECLALNVPDRITHDVSQLDLGDSVHVSDLVPPADVVIVTEADRSVAAVHVPRSLTASEEAAAKEAEGGEAAPAGEAKSS